MAKPKRNMTLSIYDSIRDYAKSLGITGPIDAEGLATLGFNAQSRDPEDPSKIIYTDRNIEQLVSAYNNGRVSKDFSEFLAIIAHKEKFFDRRDEDDFTESLMTVAAVKMGREKAQKKLDGKTDVYNKKVDALDLVSHTPFSFSFRKVLGGDKKTNTISPENFWALMASAGYTEKVKLEAEPFITTLGEAQNSLLASSAGLADSDTHRVTFVGPKARALRNLGVVIDSNDLVRPDGSPFTDVTLESAISGDLVPSYITEQKINPNAPDGQIDHPEDKGKLSYDTKRGKDSIGYLSDTAMRARMMAGKQTYSVLVAPYVKYAIGLLDKDPTRSLDGTNTKILEDILKLEKGETLASIQSRVSRYGDALHAVLMPEDNAEIAGKTWGEGGPLLTELEKEHRKECFGVQTDQELSAKMQQLAYTINDSCIRQGAYAETTDAGFLKSLLLATTNAKLGVSLDRELIEHDGEEGSGYFTNNRIDERTGEVIPTFSSAEARLYLPLTLVTEGGVYRTNVEYTRELKAQLDDPRDPEHNALLEIAKKNIANSNFGGINLRNVTSRNLIIGTNPLHDQVMQQYYRAEPEQDNELGLGGKGGANGGLAKRTQSESQPHLFKDLKLYKEYKAEATQIIQRYLCIPGRLQRQKMGIQAPIARSAGSGQDLPAEPAGGRRPNPTGGRPNPPPQRTQGGGDGETPEPVAVPAPPNPDGDSFMDPEVLAKIEDFIRSANGKEGTTFQMLLNKLPEDLKQMVEFGELTIGTAAVQAGLLKGISQEDCQKWLDHQQESNDKIQVFLERVESNNDFAKEVMNGLPQELKDKIATGEITLARAALETGLTGNIEIDQFAREQWTLLQDKIEKQKSEVIAWVRANPKTAFGSLSPEVKEMIEAGDIKLEEAFIKYGFEGAPQPEPKEPKERKEKGKEEGNPEEELSGGDRGRTAPPAGSNYKMQDESVVSYNAIKELSEQGATLQTLVSKVESGELSFYEGQQGVKPFRSTLFGGYPLTEKEQEYLLDYGRTQEQIDRISELIVQEGCNFRQAHEIVRHEYIHGEQVVPSYLKQSEEQTTIEDVLQKGLPSPVSPEMLVNVLSDDTLTPSTIGEDETKCYNAIGLPKLELEIAEQLSGMGYDREQVEDIMYIYGMPLPDFERFGDRIKAQYNLGDPQHTEDGLPFPEEELSGGGDAFYDPNALISSTDKFPPEPDGGMGGQ